LAESSDSDVSNSNSILAFRITLFLFESKYFSKTTFGLNNVVIIKRVKNVRDEINNIANSSLLPNRLSKFGLTRIPMTNVVKKCPIKKSRKKV
jgi:hypothetical protein